MNEREMHIERIMNLEIRLANMAKIVWLLVNKFGKGKVEIPPADFLLMPTFAEINTMQDATTGTLVITSDVTPAAKTEPSW